MVGDCCWLYIKFQCGSERWLVIIVGCILRFSVDQKDGWLYIKVQCGSDGW